MLKNQQIILLFSFYVFLTFLAIGWQTIEYGPSGKCGCSFWSFVRKCINRRISLRSTNYYITHTHTRVDVAVKNRFLMNYYYYYEYIMGGEITVYLISVRSGYAVRRATRYMYTTYTVIDSPKYMWTS